MKQWSRTIYNKLRNEHSSLFDVFQGDVASQSEVLAQQTKQVPRLWAGFSGSRWFGLAVFEMRADLTSLTSVSPQEFSSPDFRNSSVSSRTPTPPGRYSPHSPIDRELPVSPRRRWDLWPLNAGPLQRVKHMLNIYSLHWNYMLVTQFNSVPQSINTDL